MINDQSTDPPPNGRGVASGYDVDLDQDRPSAPSPALGRPAVRPSMARDFAGLALVLLALLLFIGLGGAWLGSVMTP